MSRYGRLVGHLSSSLSRMSGIDPAELDVAASFLDMGADSLALLQISQTVQDSTGIKVPFRLLLDDLGSIESLATYLDQRMPAGADLAGAAAPPAAQASAPAPPAAPAPVPVPAAPVAAAPPLAAAPAPPLPMPAPLPVPMAAADGSVEGLLARQLDLLPRLVDLMSRQVDLLRQGRSAAPVAAAPAVQVAAQPVQATGPAPAAKPVKDDEEYVPYKPIRRSADQELTPEQREHLAALIARVNAKTQGSKRQIDLDRVHHADSRPVTGFRRLWKELCYTLVVTDGYGGRIRDVDGNEYVDLSMGFGSLLFGHSPQFLIEPLIAEVRRGVRLGPQSYLAGEVARLVSRLTGAERVCFCNSGTEAVMTALRIARARTGRDKVAIFAGSYHGTADEVLARGEADEAGGRALPLAPGIPASAMADMMVFRYNRPQSLEAIRRHAHELAAVLIEPPRSRTPDVRPVEFLQELRRITEESGTVFIFDEVVTGFRTHPGGAQAIFDIHPDLTTYGKAVAGGMPIGIVAGKAQYMDALDGGPWRFGDDSVPEVEMTFYAGTFCKHSYTMAVAKAVLEHLDAAGPALQETLNRRTDELVRTLNDFFTAEDYPFKVVNFGSLFRFFYPPTLRLGELFFYHLLEHGVYVWEGRNCFLCTAHTEEDIAQIVAAAKASARAMRDGGVIPPKGGDGGGGGGRKATSRPAAKEPATGVPVPAGAVPLTEAQEHLWVLTQLGDEVSRAYNESMTLHLRGALDTEALRRALETVVARHEALRTTFAPDGTWQRFAAPGPVELPLVELPTGGDRQARIAAWLAAEAGTVFPDLAAGPLYRARLLKVEEGWHLLVLTLHHLVSDGFSNSVVLRELGQLYGALTRGTALERAAAELPPPVPFSQYVTRQLDERAGSEMAAAEAYWLDAFATPGPLLDLPVDRPRPPLQGHLGDRALVATGPRLAARVRQLAREQGCTLFVTLLAAYRALLHRLTGQDDLVVGTPAAGQIPAGGGHLVGYCVNLLPLRSRVAAETTAAAYLKEMRGQVLDAYEHQIYPFQRLLKKIDLPRDPSRLPLVAVTFTTEKAGHYRFAGLETELALNNNGGSKFELYLNVVEAEDDLVFDCEHNSYIFTPATVRRWLGHLCQLLDSMAEAPRERLRALPLLSAAERHQVTAEWNDTAAPYDRRALVHQLFEAQVKRVPEAPAVSFGETTWTYGELNAEANRLAHHLASLGVERGRPVAVLLHRSLEMVAALLGVLKAGGCYVPIEAGHPVERVQAVLAALEIPVVITDGAGLPMLADLQVRLPFLSQVIVLATDGGAGLDLSGRPATDLPARTTAEHPAYVIFTSGSTGMPKGVQESHRPVVNLIQWVNGTYGVGPGDRVLFITSPSFDLSVYDVFGVLAAGGSIRVASEEDLRAPERLIGWLATDGITVWDSAPAALQQIVPFLADHLPAGAVRSLRLVLQSGDWIPLALPGRVREHFPKARVVALGGATEATIWSNRHEVRDIQPHWSSIPYGRPIANARYYSLDAELAPVPLGVAGDLWIGGECLSSGYANDPALTAFRYVPDPFATAAGAVMYRTGDRARFLPDGEIEFLGRLDNQVKVRGFRIELGEIETVLAQHPAIRDAAVLARGEAREERRLVAYVVPRAGMAMPAVEELRAYLKERLPEPMVPAVFVPLDALPVTANGKLDRKALPVPDLERPRLAIGFEPPVSPSEETLAAIWKEALGVERVGRHDGFFDLGGDSILAVRIVARARREGLPLTPAHVFQYATIAELASVIDGPAAIGGAGATDGEVPLTPIQRWFFDRDLPRPGHFNQALLLRVPADLTAEIVEEAFTYLLRHHEALRMRYRQEAGVWSQTSTDVEAVRCERADLADVAGVCARLQAGLDPERGPLVRLALMSGGPSETGEPRRLAIVAHHLAVDVTSWRILMADLATACEQLRRGEPVSLGPRTTPFREWAERLAAYARSAEVERQVPLWTAAARGRALPLPRDIQSGENTTGSAAHVAVELDGEETQALLHEMPRAFRTLTHEVLLAALARVLADLTGEGVVLVDLEGNGREVELPGTNLARTVGWFTTLYPVLLELPSTPADPHALLQTVKEQLRAIPQEGIGYGLLRFGEREEVARRLAALPPAEVGFLYVGSLADVDGSGDGGAFTRATEPTGPAVAPDNPRAHLLEVYAAVQGERLRTVFTFSENLHRRDTVERLAADFLAALRSLLAASRRPVSGPAAGAVASTPRPTDFPQADISQDELDDLLVRFGEDDE